MRLNNYSYVHKKIRLLCYQLELLTGLKCITNLSENFEEIRFMSPLSYITIDYKREAYYTMSVNVNKDVKETIEDIMLNTRWLYMVGRWQDGSKDTKERKKRAKKKE